MVVQGRGETTTGKASDGPAPRRGVPDQLQDDGTALHPRLTWLAVLTRSNWLQGNANDNTAASAGCLSASPAEAVHGSMPMRHRPSPTCDGAGLMPVVVASPVSSIPVVTISPFIPLSAGPRHSDHVGDVQTENDRPGGIHNIAGEVNHVLSG